MERLRLRLATSSSSSYTPIPAPFAERQQSRVMLQFGAYTNANRVENASRLEGMPASLEAVGSRLARAGVLDATPDSCCVNLYERGQWIPPHRDNPKFERPFATVSLRSAQRVAFENGSRRVSIVLGVGSALRVGGEAADAWLHSVPPVLDARISLTFRRLSAPTREKFRAIDTASAERKAAKAIRKREARQAKRLAKLEASDVKKQSSRSAPLDLVAAEKKASNGYVPEVEIEHVWRVYDAIAPQWHGTRYKAWPRVAAFAKEVGVVGAVVADIGCGNAKNARAICQGGATCVACDVSRPLLEIAARETKGLAYECLDADATRLPWRSGVFDAALSIAVLHHVSTLCRRRAMVRETFRVLRVEGRALFYAWAYEQREFEARSGHRFESADVLVPFHFRRHGEYYDPDASAVPDHAKVDEAKNALVLQRYCHVFREDELANLVLDAAGTPVRIDAAYYDQGNWAVAATKLAS
ncbi:hypothetical protein CTAYLR_001518 [Chrysophaeum taylorii]|uniref:Fe2OG dioxygenase domain-containing protein n=1 Tax=Chrysophaeum taylorii TaxID=2483200 RepID=A0AAD7UDG1_9STRA|nr:hypothetical protein CTAYLR_001518 [Chrysophaeum taylorii]